MIRLEKLNPLGRIIRQDDVKDVAIPNWELIRQAIHEGRNEDALKLIEYEELVEKLNNDLFVNVADNLLTYIAAFGEEDKLPDILRKNSQKIKDWLFITPGVEESLFRCIESQRSHHAVINVEEDDEKYIVRLNPCGSGGRLRRAKEVAKTQKAYDWSWNKKGVPYSCLHCAMQWEILPIEIRGYPVRITNIGDRPEDPCVHLFYKRPELIPEEYFRRVGKIKTVK